VKGKLVIGFALIALIGVGAAVALQNETTSSTPAEGARTEAPPTGDNAAEEDEKPAVKSAPSAPVFSKGAVTPMKDRVAVLGLLNKRNGLWRDITMRPGQAVKVGDVVIRLRACETTAPWENQKLTGAFVQTDVRGADGQWRRVFSGWLFKESPSLNVVEHPVYDVWPKSCAMKYPDIGVDTVQATSVGGGNRSSAKKSADDAPEGNPAPEPTPSAASSNPT
jgi:hypothetical protein